MKSEQVEIESSIEEVETKSVTTRLSIKNPRVLLLNPKMGYRQFFGYVGKDDDFYYFSLTFQRRAASDTPNFGEFILYKKIFEHDISTGPIPEKLSQIDKLDKNEVLFSHVYNHKSNAWEESGEKSYQKYFDFVKSYVENK